RRSRAANASARTVACRASVRIFAMSTTALSSASSEPLPPLRHDYLPLLLVPLMAIVALPFVGSVTTWITLTIAAFAMGMMIFVMASGLTLVFGLMDVLN